MSYPGIPKGETEISSWLEKATDVVNNILQGRTNNYGSVTLTANAASTVVTLPIGRLADNSTINLQPTTANAAAAIATTYESARSVRATKTTSTFTLTHANNAQVDKTFRYAIIG